jgi:hypothetical protein
LVNNSSFYQQGDEGKRGLPRIDGVGVSFARGQVEDSDCKRPFGTVWGRRAFIPSSWRSENLLGGGALGVKRRIGGDWAVIELDDDDAFDPDDVYFRVAPNEWDFDILRTYFRAYSAGYPGGKNGELWQVGGHSNFLWYDADTFLTDADPEYDIPSVEAHSSWMALFMDISAGQSGSPVWVRPQESRYVVGTVVGAPLPCQAAFATYFDAVTKSIISAILDNVVHHTVVQYDLDYQPATPPTTICDF